MRHWQVCAPLGIVGLMIAEPSVSHHGAASMYQMDQQIVIEGIVRRFDFVNPHVRLYLDVADETGEIEQWIGEGGSVLVLRRLGWDGEEVKPGDRVQIKGPPSQDGSHRIWWRWLVLPDGKELYSNAQNRDAVEQIRRERRNQIRE